MPDKVQQHGDNDGILEMDRCARTGMRAGGQCGGRLSRQARQTAGGLQPGWRDGSAGAALRGKADAEIWPVVRGGQPRRRGGQYRGGGRFGGEKLRRNFGGLLVVDTRAGGGGNIGGDVVAKAPADGYTLVMAANYIAVNAALKRNPYDWKRS